mgnify:CR=1 FL=1
MISDYQKFRIPDTKGNNHLTAEVNWNESDEETNECKMLRVTLPDGETALVKREYLNQILFAIGKAEDQRSLIPQKFETVHWRRTTLGIKATKDIHKGEMINFPIEISFPCTNTKELIEAAPFAQSVKQEQKKDKWSSKT